MSEYTLYYFPASATVAAHWTLINLELAGETSFAVELVDLLSNAQKSRQFLAVNARGQIPVLRIDNHIITESAAILLALSERFPQLAPPLGSASREEFLETMVFLTNTFLPCLRDTLYADRDLDGVTLEGKAVNDYGVKAVKGLAEKRLESVWDTLDAQLSGRAYLVYDTVTVADFQAASILQFYPNIFEAAARKRRNVSVWLDRMKARKDFVELVSREEASMAKLRA